MSPEFDVIGGCSSIDGMIYMRGQARGYDGWGAGDGHGADPGWSWAECLPDFLAHEDSFRGSDAFHRAGGEWRVERRRLSWDILDAIAQAAQQAGIPASEDFNRGDNHGVGYFEVNQRAGVRWNDAFGQPLHRFAAFTASVCNLNPTRRGQVRIRSADAHQPPAIAPRYLSTDEERRVAAGSLRLRRRIAAQPALAKYAPSEFKPGVQYRSDGELWRLAGDIGTTIFHPVGTAKMGPAADPAAVVDARLRVHGIASLRVADASVMPRITRGNTNAPTLMIAERAARWVREDQAAGRCSTW